jgi:chemotaxis signal transduction protein
MSYLQFRIGEKEVAIESTDGYTILPTLINKISTISNPQTQYQDGYINYRGKMIEVLDLAPLFEQPKLKKFDGLIFVYKDDKAVAIKFEGFHKKTATADDCETINVCEILP